MSREDTVRLFSFSSNRGFANGWTSAIWPQSTLRVFSLIANLGLIFFMFFLGLELDLAQIKSTWKVTIPIAISSMVFPGSTFARSTRLNRDFCLVGIGCAVALWFYQMNDGIQTSQTAFILFVGKDSTTLFSLPSIRSNEFQPRDSAFPPFLSWQHCSTR